MHGLNIKIILSCVYAKQRKNTQDKYKIRDGIIRLDLSSTFICLAVST